MRLIDADKLIALWYEINDIDKDDRGARFVGYTEIERMINSIPTIDAVEVVRCKDCKYFEPDLIPIPYFEGDGACFHEHWTLEDVGFEVKEIDFCSYGERKEE